MEPPWQPSKFAATEGYRKTEVLGVASLRRLQIGNAVDAEKLLTPARIGTSIGKPSAD